MRFILLDSEEIAKIPKDVAIIRTKSPNMFVNIIFTSKIIAIVIVVRRV